MAYAAVFSLLHTVDKSLRSEQFSIPFPDSQIESLCTKVRSLQAFLEHNHFHAQSTVNNDLDKQFKDAVYEAEDIIESHVSSHLLPSEYGRREDDIFSRDLQKVLHKFDSIEKNAIKILDQFDGEIISKYVLPSSSRSAPRFNTKFMGHKDSLMQLKDQLIGELSRLEIVAVVGMVGIGKTALVDQVYYDDMSIRQFFHYRIRAVIGPNYHIRDILLTLSRSLGCNALRYDGETNDAELREYIYKNLKGRRYLVILDDIRDSEAWDDLKRVFPDDGNASRIVMTTRLWNVARYSAGTTRNIHQIRFLDKDESWDLFCDKVFGTNSCPSELVKIGKTIVQNCQGLPLSILFYGGILSSAAKTPEYWRKVADSQTSVITDNDDIGLMSMVQLLKDEQMPQHLKACFLYMGAFPINYEIPASKLIQLWVAEGFLEREEWPENYLEGLVDRSLVLVHKRRSRGGIKTCSVHSAIWHLCASAAEKDKFFRAMNRYTDGAPQKGRRLCIRKNILFAIKNVYKSVASVSTVRSLLCVGPDHLYPLRVFLHYRFLRILHALTVSFYEFPMEILKLVLLRYLALTCNGDIPGSIFELQSLQFLIVRRKLSIKYAEARSYLPIEIWNMKELRHLEVMGSDLPDPCGGAMLPNLLTLLNVSSRSCTYEVLGRTPNLLKLGIRIELAVDDVAPLCVLDNITYLSKLESLKCVVVNPIHGYRVVARPDHLFHYPSTLKKLSLSGCGFPWEDMKLLATSLHYLEVLKLRCYAFQGGRIWELFEGEFTSLKFLLMEDMDIEQWIGHGKILRWLEGLSIRHCYKLQKIPCQIDYISTLNMLEVVDCSPSVVASAMRVKEMQEDLSNVDFQLCITSSWNDKNLKK